MILSFFSRDGITVTPILGILVAIGCGLALVAVAIIIVLRVRPSGFYASGPNGGRRKNSGIRRTSNVGLGQAGTYTAGGAHIPLSTREPQEETIDLEEKEPDLIPQHKGRWYSELRLIQPNIILPSTLTSHFGLSRICMKCKTPDITAKLRLIQLLWVGIYYIN